MHLYIYAHPSTYFCRLLGIRGPECAAQAWPLCPPWSLGMINEHAERQRMSEGAQTLTRWDGDIERPLSPRLCLALSPLFSLAASVPTACFSSFTIPDWLARQPSRPCCSVPRTHEQQPYNNRKGPPLLSLAGPVSNLPGGGSCYHH